MVNHGESWLAQFDVFIGVESLEIPRRLDPASLAAGGVSLGLQVKWSTGNQPNGCVEVLGDER